MSWVITPKELSRRSAFYHQLYQMTNAGVGLPQALERVQATSFSHRSSAAMRWALGQGYTFTEALEMAGPDIPSFDLALLQAGEKSGRLPNTLKLLGDYYLERAQLARQTFSMLLYPLLLFHFAIFIGPFPELFRSGNLEAYATQTLGVLFPIYAAVGLVAYAFQSRHGERWRAVVEALTRFIPVYGSARRSLALARLCAALEALLNAGMPVIQAWEMAAGASGSPAIRRTVLTWKPDLSSGTTPAEAVNQSRIFPELFSSLYQTGEISGQLDDSLTRLQAHYQEEGSRKLRALAEWTPKLVYFAIMMMIAYRIISFWAGHFADIGKALNE